MNAFWLQLKVAGRYPCADSTTPMQERIGDSKACDPGVQPNLSLSSARVARLQHTRWLGENSKQERATMLAKIPGKEQCDFLVTSSE